MNKLILILSLCIAFQANAKEEIRMPKALQNQKLSSNYIKVKYFFSNADKISFKYEFIIKMNRNSLGAFSRKTNPNALNRFVGASPNLNYRFQNLDKLDFNTIVEKNKIYNLSKVNMNVKTL